MNPAKQRHGPQANYPQKTVRDYRCGGVATISYAILSPVECVCQCAVSGRVTLSVFSDGPLQQEEQAILILHDAVHPAVIMRTEVRACPVFCLFVLQYDTATTPPKKKRKGKHTHTHARTHARTHACTHARTHNKKHQNTQLQKTHQT